MSRRARRSGSAPSRRSRRSAGRTRRPDSCRRSVAFLGNGGCLDVCHSRPPVRSREDKGYRHRHVVRRVEGRRTVTDGLGRRLLAQSSPRTSAADLVPSSSRGTTAPRRGPRATSGSSFEPRCLATLRSRCHAKKRSWLRTDSRLAVPNQSPSLPNSFSSTYVSRRPRGRRARPRRRPPSPR